MNKTHKFIALSVLCILLSVGIGTVIAQTTNNFTVDRDTVKLNESATVTVTLTNSGSYNGLIYQGFTIPSNVAGSCAIYGGGAVSLSAGETKTVTLQIENTGNLMKDTVATFTYKVTNENGDTIYSKDVPLMFKQGLGLPTDTPDSTQKPLLQDQNNWGSTLAIIALVGVISVLVGFIVVVSYRRKKQT